MSTITTRAGKGSPLTNNEVDANFTNLNNDKLESADLSGYAELTGATFTGDVEGTEFIGSLRGNNIFKAKAGEALSKGDAVYISGISGNTPVVSLADADSAGKMPAFGLASDDASANSGVDIVTYGQLTSVDTSAFSLGDTLYVSNTPGQLTSAAPSGESSLVQNLGKVERVHATAGILFVAGAGRTNATPNLNDGQFFLGNVSNQAVSADFTTSVLGEISAGTGIGISASGVISNTDPDQTVSLAGGTGISTSGTYPNFTITNDSPDQTVSLTGAGTTTVSGTYPNFTITGAGTTYTAGSGLSLTGTEFANTAPDQTVVLTGAGATSISGTYPNFTISSTDSNTTYTAGTGITLSGTTFSLTDTNAKLNLTGGTLTGALSGTTATFSGNVNAESDIRVGAAAGAINQTGIIKENGSAYGLGLFTWGDTAPVQIGGGSLNLQKESGGGVDLKINGTTVIDSSRNLTNILSIRSGKIETDGLLLGNATYAQAIDSKSTYLLIQRDEAVPIEIWGSNIQSRKNHYFGGSDTTAPAYIDTAGNISAASVRISGTTVIDSSRNLTNIGTISSGAITSADHTIISGTSGTNTTGLVFKTTDNTDDQKYIKQTAYYMQYNGNNNEGHHFTAGGTNSLLRLHGTTNGTRPNSVDITADNGLYMNNTQIIDSSRNLTNIGTITSGAITSSGSFKVGSGTQTANGDAIITMREGNAFAGFDFHSTRTAGNIGGLRWYSTSSNSVAEGQLLVETDGTLRYYNGTNGAQNVFSISNTGAITSSGNMTLEGNLLLSGTATTTNQARTIDFTGFDKEGTTDPSDRAFIQHTTNTGGHSGSVLVISSQNDVEDGIAFETNSSSQLKHNSNTIWTAGNDGSGSGLNADLLDNEHGSYYTNAGNLNAGTLPNARLATSTTYNLGGIKVSAVASDQNFIAFSGTTGDENGNYNHTYIGERVYSGTEKSELVLAKYNDIEGTSGSDRIRHIANNHVFDTYTAATSVGANASLSTAVGTGTLYTRMTIRENGDIEVGGSKFIDSSRNLTNIGTLNGGTAWRSNNDGSGSGLDADLLDGQQGSSYLRSDTPGSISVSSSSGDLLKLANSASGQFIQIGLQQNDTDGMHHRAYLKAWKGSSTASGNVDLIVRGPAGSTTSDILSLRSGNASPTWRGQAIWNAGNDGSGSGLDADTLRGTSGDNFLRKDIAQTMSANIEFANSGTAKRGIQGTCGDNDFWFFGGGATSSNAGYLEIAAGDDGTAYGSYEPIYVRQYLGAPLTGSVQRTLTLLSNYGDTLIPNQLEAQRFRVANASNQALSDSNITSRAASSTGGTVNYHMRFIRPDGASNGQISTNYYATTYATTSDYRAKEDVQPMAEATSRLMALNPVNFQWKDSDMRTDGFLAHEVAEVVNDAVVGEKDATEVQVDYVDNEDGSRTEVESVVDSLQALDQAKLVPLLVKTIQELEARITALENA